MAKPVTLGQMQTTRIQKRLPWYLEMWVRLVREKPLGTVGAILVITLLLMAILADVTAPHGLNETSLINRLKAPSGAYPLGTDWLGRDLLSRCIYGARISMYVGLGAVSIGTTCAVILGTASGYLRGRFDMVVQRVVDAWMCFPWLVILLTLMTILKPGLGSVIFALGLGSTFSSSRVIRGAVLSTIENQYIEAARCIGIGHLRLVTRHVLPNIMAPIIIMATLGLGSAILAESALSFLGYGVPPPAPSWGGMLSGSARTYMTSAWWLPVFPGLFVSAAVFGFNMLGDALRDILDPRLRK